jgi:outer membrane immunogenic protein
VLPANIAASYDALSRDSYRVNPDLDAKFGIPFGRIMPYARLGVTMNWPGTSPHWGLGVEYAATGNFGVVAEWTGDHASAEHTKWNNNRFTVGVHYYFR